MAQQRQLATPTYLVAFALICIPVLDALMQVLPFRLHDPKWRFGAFGLLSNGMMIPVTGLLIAFVASTMYEHRLFQRILGLLSLVAAVVVAVALVVFGLDALQIRQQVQPAAQLAFRVASTTAVAKAILGILTFGGFALAAFKAPKLPRREKGSKAGMIIGAAPVGSSVRSPATPEHALETEPTK